MQCNRTELVNRRQMLGSMCAGFGSVALTGMMGEQLLANIAPAIGNNPLAPRPATITPRAKRIIFLFMHGGPSHVDTFDPKPQLTKDSGKEPPFKRTRVQFSSRGNLLASPWKFKNHGQSGIPISELFPHVATCADDLCVINSFMGQNVAHGGACMKLHTGSDSLVRPSMGAWVSYGMGTENQNLPGFITICPTSLHGGVNNFGSSFLPPSHQGVSLGTPGYPSAKAKTAQFDFMANDFATPEQQRLQLNLIKEMNDHQRGLGEVDRELEARIQAYELAFRMQTAGPEAIDVSSETQATRHLYGIDNPVTEDYGMQCLLARRFAERGVRFIQVTQSTTRNEQWDQHGGLKKGHERNAIACDKPIAGLLKDLKSRGLLDETLVLWGGEFGRTPTAQGGDGRDHHADAYTMWMAGGGVKGGYRYGRSDDWGYYTVENPVEIHDLHATMLYILGMEHEKITFTHGGRPFRLTDVAGHVLHDILA